MVKWSLRCAHGITMVRLLDGFAKGRECDDPNIPQKRAGTKHGT